MDEKFFDELVEVIRKERKRQNEMWGNEFDDKNTINDWGIYIHRYVAKATKMRELDDDHEQAFRVNVMKAITIGFAALEAQARNDGMPPRHYD
jgi:hypothetical protein